MVYAPLASFVINHKNDFSEDHTMLKNILMELLTFFGSWAGRKLLYSVKQKPSNGRFLSWSIHPWHLS